MTTTKPKKLVVRGNYGPTNEYAINGPGFSSRMCLGGAQKALDNMTDLIASGREVESASLYYGRRHVAWVLPDGRVTRPA